MALIRERSGPQIFNKNCWLWEYLAPLRPPNPNLQKLSIAKCGKVPETLNTNGPENLGNTKWSVVTGRLYGYVYGGHHL